MSNSLNYNIVESAKKGSLDSTSSAIPNTVFRFTNKPVARLASGLIADFHDLAVTASDEPFALSEDSIQVTANTGPSTDIPYSAITNIVEYSNYFSSGTSGNDAMFASSDYNGTNIVAMGGNDLLISESWNGSIQGRNGSDILVVRASNIRAYGDAEGDQYGNVTGPGSSQSADYFVFDIANFIGNAWELNPKTTWASIKDYADGQDKIAILNGSGGVTGFGDLTITQNGTHVEISTPSIPKIVLENTNLSDIDASDFIFGDGKNEPNPEPNLGILYPVITNIVEYNDSYMSGTSDNDAMFASSAYNGTNMVAMGGNDLLTSESSNGSIQGRGGSDVLVIRATGIHAYGDAEGDQYGNVTGSGSSQSTDYFVFDIADFNGDVNKLDPQFTWASIKDYADGQDKIAILNGTGGVAGFGDLTITQSGAHVEISTPTIPKIVLENTNLTDIDASDFIFGDGTNPTPTPGPTPTPTPTPGPSGEITVSSASELRAALSDTIITTIKVTSGEYFIDDYGDSQNGFRIDRNISIVSVGTGRANFHARTDFAKGMFFISSGVSVTFDGIGFYDTRAVSGVFESSNEAGIRHEGKDLTILNSHFQKNINGILVTPTDGPGGDLFVDNSTFVQNGDLGGSGQEHHIYFQGQSITVQNSSFTESGFGHPIKSVASVSTTITDTVIDDGSSSANHAVNVQGGGSLTATGNTIIKGSSSTNPYIFYYETIRNGAVTGLIDISNNQITSNYSVHSTILLGNLSDTTAHFKDNTLNGSFNDKNLVWGDANFNGDTLNGLDLTGTGWRSRANFLTQNDDELLLTNAGRSYLSFDPAIVYSGLDGDDVLIASRQHTGSEVFFGGAGNDVLSGLSGNDFLYGEAGDDIIFVGSSNTWAFGGAGQDHIVIGPLNGATSLPYISGGSGNDILDGRNAFFARIDGGTGDDLLIGSSNKDDFNGGDGDDIVYGGEGVERYLYGGAGEDTLVYASNYGSDLDVRFRYGSDLQVFSVSESGASEVGNFWESPRQFEYIQFANGVYDVDKQSFSLGQSRAGANLDDILATPYPDYPINRTPQLTTAISDQAASEDIAIDIAIPLNTFTDIDGDALTLSAALTDGSALPAWLVFDGTRLTGTPPQDFNGVLNLTVTASDGELTAGDSFSLTIDPVNDAPVLAAMISDQVSLEDQAINFAVPTGTFADIDGDSLTLSATLADGTDLPAWLNFDGSNFTGTPPLDFNGLIEIALIASDGALSASDLFALSISPVNDPPVVLTPLADVSSSEDQTVDIAIPLDTFRDVDGDALSLAATLSDGSDLPAWLSFDGTRLTGTPPPDFNGDVALAITASDGVLDIVDNFILTIDPINDAPIVLNPITDSSSAEDAMVNIALPSNIFSDVDGDALALSATLADGSDLPAWLSFDGVRFTGTPPQDFNGAFDVKVTADDGALQVSNNFQLTIDAVNDAPVIALILADQSSTEDQAIAFALPANAFTDVDGDTLTLSATLGDGTELPAWLLFDGSAFTGTPPSDFNGNLDIAVSASDGGLSVTQNFNLAIGAANDAPIVAIPLADQNIGEDTAIDIAVPTGSFTDIDGDTLTLSATLSDGSGLPGWLSFDGLRFVGTPPQDFNGTLNIQVSASDGALNVSDDFTLTIDPINDAPTLAIALPDTQSDEDTGFDVTLPAGAFTDVDGDALSLSATLFGGEALPGWVSFDGSRFTGTPPANFNGTLDIEVTASDGALAASSSFVFTIDPINDAPIAIDDDIFLSEGGDELTILQSSLLENDTDVDGDSLTVTAVTNGSNGTVGFDADGNIVYTPTSGFQGEDSFTYTISDGELTSTATAQIKANPALPKITFDAKSYSRSSKRYRLYARDGELFIGSKKRATGSLTGATITQFGNRTIGLLSSIVLDLNGNGVRLVDGARSRATFDVDGNGRADDTGWIQRGDGFLVVDHNNNGIIDNGTELSFLTEDSNAKGSLQALSVFDSNGDGLVSNIDARFNELKVWVDRNSNGSTDAGELASLSDHGIASINLQGQSTDNRVKVGKNIILANTSFTRTNGSVGLAANAVLSFTPSADPMPQVKRTDTDWSMEDPSRQIVELRQQFIQQNLATLYKVKETIVPELAALRTGLDSSQITMTSQGLFLNTPSEENVFDHFERAEIAASSPEETTGDNAVTAIKSESTKSDGGNQSLDEVVIATENGDPATTAPGLATGMLATTFQGGPAVVDADTLKIALMTQDMSVFGAASAATSIKERERQMPTLDYIAV